MTRYDWMNEGLCAQTDPEIFFPDKGTNYHQARQICASCPVRTQCATYAQTTERGLAHSYRHGAWGGSSPRQRAHTDDATYKQTRDARIVRLAAVGWDAKQIAAELNCTDRTVWRALKDHRRTLGEAA